MSQKIFVCTYFLVISITCLGQSAHPITVINPIDIIKSMRLEYNKTSDFEEVPGIECFKPYPKLESIITCAYSQLESIDKQVVTFSTLYRPLTEEDSIFISKISSRGIKSLDWNHEANIKSHIKESLGKESAKNWRKHVKFYPVDKAHRIFNADSAITYSVKLDPKNYYQGKYNHLDVLCIAKKRRGVIFFFSFYTDEGKTYRSKYQKAIEGTFKFLD